MSADPVVIVGAGHGGVQVAASLREESYQGPIVLVNAEAHRPYQRPPLSKAFMKREASLQSLLLRGDNFYAERNVDLLHDEVVEIDRAAARLAFASGRTLPYSHLVLATGARQRPLVVPGAELDGVFVLRNLDDAERLRESLDKAKRVVIIGAGFIGLEFAAVASSLGREVQVIEMAPRVMARVISPIASAFFEKEHRKLGAEFLFGAGVVALRGENGRVSGVQPADGPAIAADLVLIGIGVLPEDRIADAAEISCSNGILVDATMLTSDAHISAIGDCASHPNIFSRSTLRLESVQNAVDQARCVARRLVGKTSPYTSVPWFWSDQADLKLQITGIATRCDQWIPRGDPQTRSFSVFGYENGRLAVVESINRGGDHMASRRILANGTALAPTQAADPAFNLKALALGS